MRYLAHPLPPKSLFCLLLKFTLNYTNFQGFEIFNGVADAYKAVCDATSNLHQAWEGMISQLDTSSQFLKKDDSFSPYSGVINTVSITSHMLLLLLLLLLFICKLWCRYVIKWMRYRDI